MKRHREEKTENNPLQQFFASTLFFSFQPPSRFASQSSSGSDSVSVADSDFSAFFCSAHPRGKEN